MIRVILAAFIAFAPIAACGSINSAYNVVTGAKVSAKNVYYIRVGLRTAIETATLYVDLRPCKSGETFVSSGFQCSEDKVVAQLAPAEQVAYQAQKDLDAFLKTHPDAIGAQGVYDAAKGAYGTLINVINTYHLGAPA